MERRISVAGIEIAFRGENEDGPMLDERYGPFLVSGVGGSDACIELQLYDPPEDPWSGETLNVCDQGDHFSLDSRGLQARLASDGTWAQLCAPRLERCVDAILRYVLSRRLLSRGGLLVHASAVERQGGAWVFAGPSGVGKTTLSQELEGRVLGDEAIALLPGPTGLRAHATPYWQATPGSAPVAALVFPQQGDRNQWVELSPARCLGRLVSCVGPLLPSAAHEVMVVADAIVRQNTMHLLQITLESVDAIGHWLHPTIAGLPAGAGLVKLGHDERP